MHTDNGSYTDLFVISLKAINLPPGSIFEKVSELNAEVT
jgi:hypothetical protein